MAIGDAGQAGRVSLSWGGTLLLLGAMSGHVPAIAQSSTGATSRRPGDVIRSESIPGPAGASAWKIVYASTGMNGEPIEVSGIVIAPAGEFSVGDRPVVAWAHPTTGVAESCAPSLRPNVLKTIPQVATLVEHGYVVTATDYPGLGTAGPHPYLVGSSEGRAILDSVRAVNHLSGTGAGTRFVVWGHSQGGQAALFTGQLAASYAPELKLVGVAAIAPATDLAQLLRDDITSRIGRVLASYALVSWSEVYKAPLRGTVNPPAIFIIKRVSHDCAETEGQAYKVSFDAWTLTPHMLLHDLDSEQPWKGILADNTPGHAASGAPVYVAQGTADKIVNPAVTKSFVSSLCEHGEKVTFEQLEGVGHLTAGMESAASAINWMTDRFAGKPAPTTCTVR